MNVSEELRGAGRAVVAETAVTLSTAIPPTRAKMTAPRARRWTSIADLPAGYARPLTSRLSGRGGSHSAGVLSALRRVTVMKINSGSAGPRDEDPVPVPRDGPARPP